MDRNAELKAAIEGLREEVHARKGQWINRCVRLLAPLDGAGLTVARAYLADHAPEHRVVWQADFSTWVAWLRGARTWFALDVANVQFSPKLAFEPRPHHPMRIILQRSESRSVQVRLLWVPGASVILNASTEAGKLMWCSLPALSVMDDAVFGQLAHDIRVAARQGNNPSAQACKVLTASLFKLHRDQAAKALLPRLWGHHWTGLEGLHNTGSLPLEGCRCAPCVAARYRALLRAQVRTYRTQRERERLLVRRRGPRPEHEAQAVCNACGRPGHFVDGRVVRNMAGQSVAAFSGEAEFVAADAALDGFLCPWCGHDGRLHMFGRPHCECPACQG